MAIPSIKTVLAQAGLIDAVEFERWRQEWRNPPPAAPGTTEPARRDTLFTTLQKRHAVKTGQGEDVFLRGLAAALGWTYHERVALPEDLPKEDRKELLGKLSTKVAFQYMVMPVRLEEGRLQVAVSDPFDPAMLGAVQFDARGRVEFALAPREEIEKALKESYGVGAETLEGIAVDEPAEPEMNFNKEITEGDQDASVIKFVNQVIWEAFKDRATDIHFEPMEDKLRIRYRIDGILYETPMPETLKRYQSAIISRIKVMSGMNIAEKRLPQDGRINVRIRKTELDIRVSTVPTVYGESVSLRLLTREKKKITLTNLGFPDREQQIIERIIAKPHGIFLVTGPTGSGKSTSLYACLQQINYPTKRIITIEEPVEYEIEGINQIAVRPEIGLTFAMGLRHILRQDPNVVMVGEIRDLETAEIAIRAALTGHLVFSTLHTNDAASAFTRLIDMGIEPFLVASSVKAVMAQRLVRTLCPHCRTEQHVEPEYLRRIGFPEEKIGQARFSKGTGCDKCRQLGYQGRTGLYELLAVTETIRPLIMNRSPASTIAQKALEEGTQTLRMAGWLKVEQGVTTIEEVLRVSQIEQHLAALLGDERTLALPAP